MEIQTELANLTAHPAPQQVVITGISLPFRSYVGIVWGVGCAGAMLYFLLSFLVGLVTAAMK